MKKLKIPFLKDGVEITIIRGDIRRNYGKLQKTYNLGDFAENANAVTVRCAPEYFILLTKNPKISTCCHEALHCVEDIMDNWHLEDEELKAYLIGWITEECYEI